MCRYGRPWSGRPTEPVFATDSRALAPNVERNEWGEFRFQQNRNRSNVSGDGRSGGSGAAAGSGSDCDCDNAVLRIGDPRTSGYRLLSSGVRGLPAASTLVSARLGIDGALSMRHLCLWTCLLSTSLLSLSCGLSLPACVHSRCPPGSSPAISTSGLVVVKIRLVPSSPMRSEGF